MHRALERITELGKLPLYLSQELRVKTRKTWIVGGAVAAVLAVGFLGYLRSAYGPSVGPDGSASASPSALAAPLGSGLLGGSAVASPAQIMSQPSLDKAIATAKPEMDDTLDKLDEGSALLTLWASKYLGWDDLTALPETSPALFRKDPAAERGRRMCATGTITEIRAETTLARRLLSDHAAPLPNVTATPPGGAVQIGGDLSLGGTDAGALGDAGPLLNGALGTSAPDPWVVPGGKVFFTVLTVAGHDEKGNPSDAGPPFTISAIAVRNTDKLVEGSTGRVCGILTGVNEISRKDGTNVLSHRIVGMFDLPENHQSPPAPTSAAASSVAKPAPAAKGKPKEG